VAEVFTITHPSMFCQTAQRAVRRRDQEARRDAGGDSRGTERSRTHGGDHRLRQGGRGAGGPPLLADPDMPKKARADKRDEIRPCIRCFRCFAGITTKRQYRCTVNPEIGFEQDSMHARLRPPARGAGGRRRRGRMQAALAAAERGHEVILCEKEGGSAEFSDARTGYRSRGCSAITSTTRRG
jgi:hypothetical protein